MNDQIQDWFDAQEEKGLDKNYFLIKDIIFNHFDKLDDHESFLSSVKAEAKAKSIPLGQLFMLMRLALTGEMNGIKLNKVIDCLGSEKCIPRFKSYWSFLEPGWELSEYKALT